MPRSPAFSLDVLELLTMAINPTKFSRFSKDLSKKREGSPIRFRAMQLIQKGVFSVFLIFCNYADLLLAILNLRDFI